MVARILSESGEIEDITLPTLTEPAEMALKALPRQRALFVRYYVQHLDKQKAYTQAGYSETGIYSNVYRIMSDARVLDAIDECLELKAEAVAISASVIEQEYWQLYKEARHNKDRAVARQCLKDLGEYYAMFVKVKVNVDTKDIERRLIEGRKRTQAMKDQALNGDAALVADHIIDGQTADQHPFADTQPSQPLLPHNERATDSDHNNEQPDETTQNRA